MTLKSKLELTRIQFPNINTPMVKQDYCHSGWQISGIEAKTHTYTGSVCISDKKDNKTPEIIWEHPLSGAHSARAPLRCGSRLGSGDEWDKRRPCGAPPSSSNEGGQ